MQSRFQAQLKEFREDDEARWKYEEQELQRQMRILAEIGRTDKEVKAELETSGINVCALEKESYDSVQKEEHAQKKLLEIEPPPPKRGLKEQILMQQIAGLAGSHTWLYPPAYEGWGNAEECGFNLALGEINTEVSTSGEGWGWQAVAYGTEYCTLWFYYFPPTSGELLVEPHVDFQGNVAVSAHDHTYTSTHAKLRLKLHFDLYQHYWDGEQVATIIDEHRHNSSAAYWVDDHRIMSKTLSVSANDIVWIKLKTSLFVMAHSSHAHVDVDFRTGSSRRIRTEHIWVSLTPALTALPVEGLKVKG